MADIKTIRDDFEFLDDWEDRYRYVIELGRTLPPLPEAAYTDTNKVRGCASQVWLQTERTPVDSKDGPIMGFRGDSDAMIVKGLIAILLALHDGKPAREIVETDTLEKFAELGLNEALSPQRSNGLASMAARIKADAEEALRGS